MNSNYAPFSIRLVLIIVGISGILLSRFTNTWDVIAIILFIVQLICLEQMLKDSTIFLTVYFRLVLICTGVYLIGALFKILHWEGGDLLLLSSLSGIALIYLLRTVNKKNIRALDIIKAAWVFAACSGTIFRLFHWQYADLIGYINILLFAGMFILFIISPDQERKEDIPYKEKPIDQVE